MTDHPVDRNKVIEDWLARPNQLYGVMQAYEKDGCSAAGARRWLLYLDDMEARAPNKNVRKTIRRLRVACVRTIMGAQ
jgi:hypothetical protein